MAPSLQQKLFVEFVGTALLCFTVSCLPKVAEDMVGITVGGVLMLLVYAGGPQSGGHYNPAVTLAILVRGRVEFNLRRTSRRPSRDYWYVSARIHRDCLCGNQPVRVAPMA